MKEKRKDISVNGMRIIYRLVKERNNELQKGIQYLAGKRQG